MACDVSPVAMFFTLESHDPMPFVHLRSEALSFCWGPVCQCHLTCWECQMCWSPLQMAPHTWPNAICASLQCHLCTCFLGSVSLLRTGVSMPFVHADNAIYACEYKLWSLVVETPVGMHIWHCCTFGIVCGIVWCHTMQVEVHCSATRSTPVILQLWVGFTSKDLFLCVRTQ